MNRFILICVCVLAPTFVQAQVWGNDDEREAKTTEDKPIELRFDGRPDAVLRLKGRMVSQGHYRNDNDFDVMNVNDCSVDSLSGAKALAQCTVGDYIILP